MKPKAVMNTPDWTEEDKMLRGIENRGLLTWLRTSKITRGIARKVGLKEKYKDIKIIPEFPRGFCRYMKELDKNNLIGAEIGIMSGWHTRSLLQKLSIKKLYLIDPYKFYDGAEDYYTVDEETLKEAEKRLDKWKEKIIWIKKLSSEAVDDIPDNLDFVYIDGNHRYEYVKEDIKNYYPKLKIGGILSGHDFDFLQPGVIKAVIDFVYENNLKLNTHPFQSDWWIVKYGI